MHNDQQAEQASFDLIALLGRTQTYIEAYALSYGIPNITATRWLGELLLGEESGPQLGTNHTLPTLRKDASTRGSALEPLALASSSRGGARASSGTASNQKKHPVKRKKRRLSPEGRKAIQEAVKRRWAKVRKANAAK